MKNFTKHADDPCGWGGGWYCSGWKGKEWSARVTSGVPFVLFLCLVAEVTPVFSLQKFSELYAYMSQVSYNESHINIAPGSTKINFLFCLQPDVFLKIIFAKTNEKRPLTLHTYSIFIIVKPKHFGVY